MEKKGDNRMDISTDTLKKFSGRRVAFIENMGLKTIEARPGYVKLKAPLKGNENHIGIMYAGALFTMAEVPAATAITLEMTMSEGEVDRIQTEAEANGKADYVLEGELKDDSGEVIALSKGVYQIRAIATG